MAVSPDNSKILTVGEVSPNAILILQNKADLSTIFTRRMVVSGSSGGIREGGFTSDA